MKSCANVVLCLAVSLSLAVCAADVLVSREDRCVERWRVDSRGAWARMGLFIDGGRSDVKPTGVAVHDGAVYVADSRGPILRYDANGVRQGEVAKMAVRPDKLCISPDGRWLFVSCVLQNRVYRYSLADGQGGEYPLDNLAGPRTLRFGPDGLLYVACRATRSIRAYDVSGEKGVQRGAITVGEGRGCFAFVGEQGGTMVVPGSRIEIIDLFACTLSQTAKVMENAFASCVVDGVAYAGDWTRGEIFRVDAAARAAERVATGVGQVTALATLDGSTAEKAMRAAFAKAGSRFTFRQPMIPCSPDDFSRMKFNNPGAVTWLKAGFGGTPYVLDYDGDGQKDLLVYSGWEGQVWEGWWFFRNPTPKGKRDSDPIFEAPVRVTPPPGLDDVGIRRYADGSVIGRIRKTDAGYESRHLVDFDGDGLDDLVIASSEQAMAVWDVSGFDDDGNWIRSQYPGSIYWCRCLPGGGKEPRYARPQIVRLDNGDPMTATWWCRPMFSDWDGDGDLDAILQSYMEDFIYFENIGTRTKPVYEAGRFLRHADGERLVGYQCHPCTKAIDWDDDGLLDIVRCEEEGRVYWYRNTGKVADRMPVFEKPRFFRQRAADLCVSAMSAPWAFDIDGDGDEDIVNGDTAGTIHIFENLSGPGTANPKFAPPRQLTTPDGNVLRILAGPNGSIQGPVERMYGYVVPSVADWDGDGLPDIMCNSVWGRFFWLKNLGPRDKPQFDFPRDVEVEWDGGRQPALAFGWQRPEHLKNPRSILTMWRTTPVMIDWNRDGFMDLVAMDTDGVMALYERGRRADGTLFLKRPRKAFRDENGNPFLLAYNWAGGPAKKWEGHIGWCGRRKFCFCDWDGDGLLDVVMNGWPNADVYLQIPGDGNTWSFKRLGPVGEVDISTHDPQPTACDFDGDGVPDIIVGAMDGYLYRRRNLRRPAKPAATAGAVLPHPTAEGLASTSVYRVTVDGTPVDVMGIPAPSMHDGQLPEDALEPYYAAFFDADREVDVVVESPGDLSHTRILPLSRNVKPRVLSPGKIAFRAKPPFTLSVEPQPRHRALILSARIPDANPPKQGAKGVRWYGPGRYREEKPIRLNAGETLYLAPGAYVEGCVVGEGNDITVCGHGMLSGLCWNWLKGPAGNMMFFKGTNITLKGFTVVGSFNWTIRLEQSEHVVVDGVNILNGHVLNDDGIDVCRSRDVTIRDCFIRAQDDCITPKYWCENLTVERCSLWTDVANIFRIGYECDGPEHRYANFRVRDIDILHQSVHKPPTGTLWSENAVYIQASNGMTFEDFVFDGFRFDAPEKGDNLANVRTITIRDQYQQHKEPGHIRNMEFRNFTFPKDMPAGCETVFIESVDSAHKVENVTFPGIDPRIKFVVKPAGLLGGRHGNLRSGRTSGCRLYEVAE